MILTVPRDRKFFPTLGPAVCSFIEEHLVFGPGDLRGRPAALDDEKRALIYRLYEVFPKGHALAGRRRFKRAGLSLPKGVGKTELAAWIAACELHPRAPVRCIGWDGKEPTGGPVTDPYIPLVAYTEEQSDELAYGTLRVVLEESGLKDDFDIGLERIMRRGGDGKAVSLSSSPNARDGARTTYCVMDETHHWTLPRLKKAHQTMLNNLAKRKIADPWMLEITTAPEPGAGSVAESTMEYAKKVQEARVKDSSLFFFHRQASDQHDISKEKGARAAVIEAAGPSAEWRDVEAIIAIWKDPEADRAYWERVWCNRLVQGSTQAFDVEKYRGLAESECPVVPGDPVTLGFDGAVFHDSVALVGTHVRTGYQWLAGLWERPPDVENWQAPEEEIDAAVARLFETHNVWRLYADPPYWQSWIATWVSKYGEDRVAAWHTWRRNQMSAALENFDTAIRGGALRHDGSRDLIRHLGNARRRNLPMRDDQGRQLWLIQKERKDSPHKIDAAMAAVLSWEARTDAIAAGILNEEKAAESVYKTRGAHVFG